MERIPVIQLKKNLKEIGKEFKQMIDKQTTVTDIMNLFLEYNLKLNAERMSHIENTRRQYIYTSKAMKKHADDCVVSAPGYDQWLEIKDETNAIMVV